jgi:hypothetical protein
MKQIKLQLPKLPRKIGDLTHSNQFLKFNVLASYTVTVLLTALLFAESYRSPTVLTLTPGAIPFESVSPPKPEDEVAHAVRAYVALRYRWDQKSVNDRLRQAEAFIPPASRKAFEAACASISKFAQERGVLQRVYPADSINVDLEKKTALVTGDRITAIQGLKAVADLRLSLDFEAGPRTRENPWGVYVVKEREE